ncbi:proliferation marker protein Ki-67 isoform X2 [Mastomys coucha]|uniref:proliferation marker protein Ki-67 isoform X2 n=1 Tax=Mastomys coucha TaxID=35658 RepID=UPI00126196DA|nr:proliferation marker protein Ki-67 isoform X2 [Mastomys coucha]
MASSARLVTIKRSGEDGAHFPLSLSSCLFGRSIECDIRIQLPVVSKKHCKIEVKEQEATLYNFSSTNPTQVNGATIDEPVRLRHGDIITIIDRSFRYEDGSHEDGSRSTEFPGRSLGKEPSRRASRDSFSADPDKSEGMPSKRRRVSFGGHLRPELFDENLPPNTPLKRGETPTKRKSLGTHSPAVLKKIIKERPQSPGKHESPGITPPRTNDQRRRSGRTSLPSSGSKFVCETDVPKKAGRKSGTLPAKRASISRSQHGILQMICSKRRSGASEANLIVAKSWADVVKLGVKQTQMKVVKHVPQKQTSKRQRRPSTPKKPTSTLHNQFSTGHANSPCTIIVGRAQIEKVSVPARPYKMLNNLTLNRKVDFSEDLSGLTEMFKTPVKEKQQQMSDTGSVLSNSDNLFERQLQVTNSGDTPLPNTPEILGEKVLSNTQNEAKQQSDRYSASPALRRRSIKRENTVQTPKNAHNIAPLEKKTPGSETEPLKTALSMSKLRRSRELRHTLAESMNEKTEPVLAESITGRHLKKTFGGQEVDQQVQDSRNSSQRCKENGELNEGSEKTSARRSSARKQKPTKDLIGSQMVTQTVDYAEKLLSQEQRAIQNLDLAVNMQNTLISDDQGITKQKVNIATKEKFWPKTPSKMTQPLESQAGLKTSTKPRSSTPGKKVDVEEELCAPTKLIYMSGKTRHTSKVLERERGDIKDLKQCENEMLAPTVSGSKRALEKAKEKAQPLEDLTGFQELFLSPVPGDKVRKMSSKFSHTEPVRTPASTKRLSKTGLAKVDVREEPSTLEKRTKSPGRATGTPAPVQEENESTAFMETPKQKLDFTGNSTGHKRRSRTPKNRVQPLEDLDGFQELFQTPAGASDPLTVDESAKMSLESSQAEPVRTLTSSKRLSKTGFGKVDVREEPSTLGKRTKSPGRATGTPAPMQEENDSTAFLETPKQKLDFTENLTGHKRRLRTPKIRVQPLEDLDGVQELFQTPAGASDPVAVDESAKMSLESSQTEPVRTVANTKRLSERALSKGDVGGALSLLSKPTCASQKVMHTLTLSEDHGRETKDVKELLAQTLDPAVHVTRGKRQQGSCKKRSQSQEDLFGLQELFQTSGHNRDSVTLDSLTKLSGRSPPPVTIDTSVSSRRQTRTGLRKVHVKNELSGDIMHPQMSGEIIDLSREPECEDKVIKTRKQSVKRKLDTTVNVPGSKRQRVTRKAEKTLEDLPGFQELCYAQSLVMDSVIVDKTTKMPSKSPEPVNTTSETQPRRQLRRLGMTEKPIPQRKTTRVLRQTRNIHKEPIGDSKGIEEFMESSAQKQLPAICLTGRRNPPRRVKEKTQPLEDLTTFPEETATRMSSKSPQPEEKKILAGLERKLKIQLFKVSVEGEPTAQRKQPARETRNTLKKPVGDSINVEELKKSTKRKIDPVASVPVNKRPQRVPKEKAQPLELAGLKGPVQTIGHTEESASDRGPTQIPCNSLHPEQVDSLQSSPRRPRTRHGKIEADKEPSAVRKTSRQAMRSRKIPEIDDNGTQASEASIKQTLDTVDKVTGSRRQLRTRKDGVQPHEVLGDSKEITRISDHSEKLTHDLKSTVQQKPDSAKPLRTCRRVLRVSKEDPKEMLVDTRDSSALQSKSAPFLSPKRKSVRDGSILKTRALRSVTPKQEATDEKLVPKNQRAASSKRHLSPEPVKMKHLRIVSNKLESVEEQVSTVMKTEEMEAKRENPVTADQKTPECSRYRKKNNEKQPRPRCDASAEKVEIKKNEKTMKTVSQETELQNPDDGAKKSTSRGKVSGKRTCLRSRGQTEIPQPCEAEEKTSKSGAEILTKTQKEKGASGDSDVRCLRSRKTRVTLDSEPKPRVTRGAKKDAKTPKKDEDIVYTKKLRTRSHQKSETV